MKPPKIITLCGSTRFMNYFVIMAWELEKQGAIVLGLHLLPDEYFDLKGVAVTYDHLAEAEDVKEHFDNLHFRKIEMSDSIYVLNVNGYIGNSTRREIKHAEKMGKPVAYLEEPK